MPIPAYNGGTGIENNNTITITGGNLILNLPSDEAFTLPTSGTFVTTTVTDLPNLFNVGNTASVITSNSTIPGWIMRIEANEAISVGDILKMSTTVNYRVEKVKFTDAAAANPVVGIAKTSAAGVGDIIEVYGMIVMPVILNATTNRGQRLARSGTVNGRVVPSTGAGVFGVAMQSGVIGDTILAAKI